MQAGVSIRYVPIAAWPNSTNNTHQSENKLAGLEGFILDPIVSSTSTTPQGNSSCSAAPRRKRKPKEGRAEENIVVGENATRVDEGSRFLMTIASLLANALGLLLLSAMPIGWLLSSLASRRCRTARPVRSPYTVRHAGEPVGTLTSSCGQ